MAHSLRALTLAAVLCGILLPSGLPRCTADTALVSGWEPAGDVRISSGGNVSFFVNCTASACSTVVFQWSVAGALVAGETGPRFTFTAGTNLSGTVRISVFVSDGSSSARNGWNVTVDTPVLTLPEGPVSMAEGEVRTFRVLGVAGRDVSWFLDGADLGTNGTEFVYGPDFLSAGTRTVSVSVEGAPVHAWTVTVSDMNRPPMLPQGRLVQAYTGEPASVKVNASDPDGSRLRYRWDLDSDGTAELDSSQSGNLSHRFTRSGVYRATLTVTDEGGGSATTVYLFDVRDRASPSGWWLPAALAGAAALVLVVVVSAQARRLSRTKEARARSGFFAKRERPAPEAKAGAAPEAEPPLAAAGAEAEPELLQVRSLLPAKRAELEASPGQQESEIPLSRKLTPSGPPGVPAAERTGSSEAAAGALRDKGAESESGAQETELGKRVDGWMGGWVEGKKRR